MMLAPATVVLVRGSRIPRYARAFPEGGPAYWLSAGLAAVASVVSLITIFVSSALHGPAVMAGSARGTALVVVLVGVPVLLGSMILTAHGSAAAVVSWLGATGFLTYNAVMYLFATPFNRLFLLDVAMLALSAWSLGAVAVQTDVRALAARFASAVPVRGIAAYIWVVATLNAMAWLSGIVPAVVHGGVPSPMAGTGLTTSPVYVQDLALWLPLFAVGALLLWRLRPWGFLVAAAGLVMWVIESVSVAVDQAYGHAADPSSAVASARLTPAFLTLALVGLVPLAFLFRGFEGRTLSSRLREHQPAIAPRTWRSWVLVAISLFVGLGAMFGGIALLRNGFGMPRSWLDHTPFTGWQVPGVALLIGVAVPQLLIGALLLLRDPWARTVALLAGVALVLWIVIQLLVLQRYFFLQPVIAGFGVVEALLAGSRSEREQS